jgi:hypothetical protein
MSHWRPNHPCEWPEQAPRAPNGAETRHGALCASFPACYGTVDRVNLLVVAPSIIDGLVRSPVDTSTTLSGVAVECSREHHGQGTDRCKSRLASGSAKIVHGRPLELPRGIHRVLFPHVAVQPNRFQWVGNGSHRHTNRQEAMGHRLHGASLHFPPQTSRLWPLLRGKRSHMHETRR